jgi:hypothetical protein
LTNERNEIFLGVAVLTKITCKRSSFMKIEKIIASLVFLFLILVLAPLSAFSSDLPTGFSEYTIKAKDSLQKIAPESQWDIIKRVNRMDFHRLPVGKKILIPTDQNIIPEFCPVPKEMMEVKDKERAIFVFLDIQYFGAYENGTLVFWGPISSGKKKCETPKGSFDISVKYRHYRSVQFGSKMPFAMKLSTTGKFLHQELLPGYPASHGCIRLLRTDAEKLFIWAQKGDFVYIV